MAIYFLTPDYTHPSGGVHVIYRHVDILNAHGMKAYVLHTKPGFRCEWFANTPPIAYQDKSLLRKVSSKILKLLKKELPHEIHLVNETPIKKLTSTDYLVLPEIYGPTMTDMAPGVPRV
ncbi:hypothetical protein [methanotrophic endosymbiont of Bathymodiolus puteoserpentis (Logatchev)]|jgi:hypothetical protein|uniref:hypothetical protein n=1 Tax=methanotrophic endosymbiont of Bathymodiolus puteoserpentis (Logatchev) TaxID=343235 RepID=UPI00157A56CD|nr:hypothetical protein [methanotrophic endosymbiont of Bathymodiolus puteoserpentis (Logatchev)]